jgi:hypothetical protein
MGRPGETIDVLQSCQMGQVEHNGEQVELTAIPYTYPVG